MSNNLEKVILYSLVAVLIIVAVADILGALDEVTWISNRIPTIVLLFLSMWIGFWFSQKQNENERAMRLEKLVSQSIGEIHVLKTTEEAFDYLAKQYEKAQLSIDQAAIAPSISTSKAYSRYDQVLKRILKNNQVKYRHVTFLDSIRWKRLRVFLQDEKIEKYFARCYDLPEESLPGLSFSIIDDEEIVMRYPYDPGQSEIWLSIKHPEVVRLFSAYYRNLWANGIALDKSDNTLIDGFDKKYGG